MGVYARARARKEGHGGMRAPDTAREYEQVKWAGLGYCRTMVRRRGVEKMRTRDGVSICVREYERVERGGLRLP